MNNKLVIFAIFLSIFYFLNLRQVFAQSDQETKGPTDQPTQMCQKEIIIGGFDGAKLDDLPRILNDLDKALPIFKAAGITSHESYVKWNFIEKQKGRYDFSYYDAQVELYKKYGIKWVPFLIFGSAYALPDWFYKSPEDIGYICLEHNKESDIASLWNPKLREYLRKFIEVFAEHYKNNDVVESVLLGITGNYGESIYPATSDNDWTADIHGKYHTHAGFWAGDKYAVEDYRTYLKEKYKNLDILNTAWETAFKDFDELSPRLKDKTTANNEWLDFIDWYKKSMTDYTELWVKTVRENMPNAEIYICTGGHAPAEHGADFSAQTKAAMKYNAGIRITNEGSDYSMNFALTRWVASAGKFYNTYYAFEPAGSVDAGGVNARIYNAVSSSAKGLHYYYDNIFSSESAKKNWMDFKNYFACNKSIVPFAVLYPKISIDTGESPVFIPMAQQLRDYIDFDIADEIMINDGALENYKSLLIIAGNRFSEEMLRKIDLWLKNGGVLISVAGEQIRTIDDKKNFYEEWFKGGMKNFGGRIKNVGNGKTFYLVQSNAFGYLSYGKVMNFIESLKREDLQLLDGIKDDVFITEFTDSYLFYNGSNKTIQKKFKHKNKEK